MPCNSEHMKPTEAEKDTKETAKCLVYALKELDIKPVKWVVKASKECYTDTAKLDKLVKTLCAVCSNMTKKEQEKIIYNGKSQKARTLANWWDLHKKADAKRIKEEKAYARKTKLRKSVLSKLTPQEIESLDI